MFESRFIRGSDGLIVGRIDEDDHGSSAYDAGGNYVGRYDRYTDHNHDSGGRVKTIAGDALASLIFRRKRCPQPASEIAWKARSYSQQAQ